MELIGSITLWLFLSIIAGVIASGKGRSGFGFFMLSVLLSPLIGIICALVVAPNTLVARAKAPQIKASSETKTTTPQIKASSETKTTTPQIV